MRNALLTVLIVSLCVLTCHAQSVPAQRLLLLIAGPSGDRISPTEQNVVSYMNRLRGEYGLYDLQMGTMHFDRAQEASILTGPLGFSPRAGVTVGLVQLSEQGIPIRTIYKAENVTEASLESEHRNLLGRWSELSDKPLPQALASSVSTTSNPPASIPDQTTSTTPPPNPPAEAVVFTFEGIRKVATTLQQQTSDLWLDFRNQPSRDDRMDVPVRTATLDLLEATTNLKTANESGIIFPLEQLKAVRLAGQKWKLTEPQYYLPPHLRAHVDPLLELIEMVEAIEYQGAKG
jgi:hypothetical protein